MKLVGSRLAASRTGRFTTWQSDLGGKAAGT